MSAEELNKELLDTTRSAFKRMEPEIKELGLVSGNLIMEQVAKNLAHKIHHNKALMSVLPSDGKITPRSIAQLVVMG